MKQHDTDKLTGIANAMDLALTEFRQAIRDLEKVVDQSLVGNKGALMSAEEVNDLEKVVGAMRRIITEGFTWPIGEVSVIIGWNVIEAERLAHEDGRRRIVNLLERLDAAGIRWERPFCEFGGGTAYISFRRDHPHALGYKQYEATIHVKVDDDSGVLDAEGVWKYRIFKPEPGRSMTVPEKRADCVRQAQEWAEMRLGDPEWVAGPFPDSWQTKDTRERALALLDEMSAS